MKTREKFMQQPKIFYILKKYIFEKESNQIKKEEKLKLMLSVHMQIEYLDDHLISTQ